LRASNNNRPILKLTQEKEYLLKLILIKMKKLIYGSLFLAIVGVLVIGCKKDSVVLPRDIESVENVNGILKFIDNEHVNIVLDKLSKQYLAHEDEFINKHKDLIREDSVLKDLSGSDWDDVESSVGYNQFLPYEAFENSKGLKSLRSIIREKEDEWLNSDQQEEETYLDLDFIVEDVVQTILNDKAEIIIGDTIFKFYEGGYIAIPNLNFNVLETLRELNSVNNSSDVVVYGNVEFLQKSEGSCRGHVSTPSVGYSIKQFGSGSRMKWRIAIQTFPWSRYVVARTKAYTWKGGVIKKWKPFRCHIKCRVWGEISDYSVDKNGNKIADCSKSIVFNTAGCVFSDRYNVKSWEHKVYVSTKVKSGWVKGYHYAYIGATREHNSVLTFN
jgi:hypothetical protein